MVAVTVELDDAEIDRKNAVQGVMNRNKAQVQDRGIGGAIAGALGFQV